MAYEALLERMDEIQNQHRLARLKPKVGYFALHYRVYNARGRADEYVCRCGLPAKEWASIHDADPYDTASYEPMCLSCHARYDGMEGNFRGV